MANIADTTPVIIGVGQFVERIGEPGYAARSPVALATEAARRACEDALSVAAIAPHIDLVAAVRQFENSTPMAVPPFGKSTNFPRSVANRLNADPARAVLEISGGQGPQHLVNEIAAEIAAGSATLALLVGAEAISTALSLAQAAEKPDWAETVEGQLEDRGYGLKGLINRTETAHRITGAPVSYSLLENARRGELGLGRDEYAVRMGRLFAPFSEIAAANPYSATLKAYDAEALVAVTEQNRMITEPYRRRLVSRDQVNQAAALLVCSVAQARALGVPEEKWIYLHGHCDTREKSLAHRPDPGQAPSAPAAARAALEMAGLSVADIDAFDFYSCFPIAVANVADALGIAHDDPRRLTVTGGLPYFGGAGNNYSMHAIASMVEKLRAAPGSFGLVGANGGILSKYSVGIYSTRPAPFQPSRNAYVQARLDLVADRKLTLEATGEARIVTYSIIYGNDKAAHTGVILGELIDGQRFFAITPEADAETLQAMLTDDPLGRTVYVQSVGYGNRFTFDPARLAALFPAKPKVLRDDYEFVKVERRGRVLEITINRPDQRNSLHPPAHEELNEIFDAYFADSELWIAIITGAGTDAFCTGNDLKYRPDARGFYTPASGFGGITARRERTKPVIAAVNGYAMGGGMEISLACDLIVADPALQFALSEVKVGVIAGAGGIVRLPRNVPRKIAVEMILTGRRMGLEEALRYGLVNRAAEKGKALETARELADLILEGSPSSVRLSLGYFRETEGFASEIEAARHPAAAIDELLISADMYEGMKAFAQKRKPHWTGH